MVNTEYVLVCSEDPIVINQIITFSHLLLSLLEILAEVIFAQPYSKSIQLDRKYTFSLENV